MRVISILFSFTNQTQQMARDVCQTQRAMKGTRGQPSLNNPAFCTREAVSLCGTCDNLRRCYNKTMAYLEFTTPLTGSAERPPPTSQLIPLRRNLNFVKRATMLNRHADDALRQHHESHLWALAVRSKRNRCWGQCLAQQTRLASRVHEPQEIRIAL